jgi:diguanylate cyclase (GGDEF)-like protein
MPLATPYSGVPRLTTSTSGKPNPESYLTRGKRFNIVVMPNSNPDLPQDATHARLLVVDDSRAIGSAVARALHTASGLTVDYAESFKTCEALLTQHGQDYRVAVVDLNLPDAPDGQAVDLVLGNGIATIVLTGMLDAGLHTRISGKAIVDYVVKQNPGAIETVQRDVRRVLRNASRKALVVDDSASYRAYLKTILLTQRLNVLEAGNGKEALALLESQPDISLVITDYEMPEMDGVHLTVSLRNKHSSSALAVVGLSGADDTFLGVRFLKAGANDLVRKPFLLEEFVSRINTCLDHLDDIQTIRDQANRDYLTRLYNRRYLFDIGGVLYKRARRGQISLLVALLDLDHFKRINDTHGHDIGDRALVALAKLLSGGASGMDIAARLGGEEFCLLAVNVENPPAYLERWRARIAALRVPTRQGALSFTTSIGATTLMGENLDAMINKADEALYLAKSRGRDRVVILPEG